MFLRPYRRRARSRRRPLVLDARGGSCSLGEPARRAMFRADPVGCALGDLVPDPARLWAAVEGLATGAHVPAVPLEGGRADGVPFALDASVRVLEGGGLLCVLRELDRQLTGTLDAAFDHMPIGMALFNTDGEFVRVNPAMCALLGRDADELLGIRDQELTHPDDRQNDLDAAWRILRGELEHLAVREALRAPGRRSRLGAGEPHLPPRRARPPAVLGRPVPGHHRAAPAGLARPAHRCAQPARVRRWSSAPLPGRRRAAACSTSTASRTINDIHGHQAGRRVAARTAGAIAQPAAARRRARPPRRRRVRRAAPGLPDRRGRARGASTSPC